MVSHGHRRKTPTTLASRGSTLQPHPISPSAPLSSTSDCLQEPQIPPDLFFFILGTMMYSPDHDEGSCIQCFNSIPNSHVSVLSLSSTVSRSFPSTLTTHSPTPVLGKLISVDPFIGSAVFEHLLPYLLLLHSPDNSSSKLLSSIPFGKSPWWPSSTFWHSPSSRRKYLMIPSPFQTCSLWHLLC